MKFKLYSHRFAEHIVKDDEDFIYDYNEIVNVIESIDDLSLKARFQEEQEKRQNTKSLSTSINGLIKEGLEKAGWNSESAIFKEEEYIKGNTSYWRLDFAKNNISIEVAFNHQEATAHNIMKPVLAGELNHVEKEIQSKMGVIICATDNLKKQGIALVQSIHMSHQLVSYFKNKNQLDEVYVKCKKNPRFQKWEPYGLSHEPISNVSEI